MTWLIGSALRLRRLVLAVVVAVLALGLLQLQQAAVDVYPEYEDTAVQVRTEAVGLSALEVEQLITVPLEQNLLNGIPRLDEIRSRSMPGLAVVDLTFEPGTDLYDARQLVQERMTKIKLLPHVGTPPTMIQPTASASRVAMIGMTSDSVSLIDMSVLARWQMKPRLMAIPGVANVSVWGLRDRQLQVHVDPDRLVARNVTLTQLIETTGNALWVSPLSFVEASTPGTGGFLESPNQRIGVQHISPISTADQLADVTVEDVPGPPLRLGDIAELTEDHQPLIGDSTADGERGLMLVVERFPDANTAQVTRDVEAALTSMSAGLTGITVDPTIYRPTTYLDSALDRLGVAALIGLVLVVAVIALVTYSWRATLVAVTSIGTSLVAGVWVLHLAGQTLTTMTLLGLAAVMALVVDDAVGDQAVLRARIAARRETGSPLPVALVVEAVLGRRTALAFATVTALVAVTPLLLLSGTSGAFARPALLAFVLAALASLLVALVVTPTSAVMLLDRPRTGRAAPLTAWVRRPFERGSDESTGRRTGALVALAVLAGAAVIGGVQLPSGAVLPELQDRSVLVRMASAPGTALQEMDRITSRAAEELRSLPGVRAAGTHVGRAEGADTVTDVDTSEIWLAIDEDADYGSTLEAVRSTVAGYPGLRSEVRTYAADRLAAVEDPDDGSLVVRVYGQDFATMQDTAEQVREVLATVPGIISPVVRSQPRQPVVEVQVDLAAARDHGIQPGDVRRAASTIVSGLVVGSLYEQQAIFDVVVWGGPATRQTINDLESLRVDAPNGQQVPLGDVADVVLASDPSVIGHDRVSRHLDVTARLSDRDPADIARDADERLRRLTFPYEYRAEVVGDAAAASDAWQRVLTGAGIAIVLVYLLLQAATGSWRGSAVLLVCLPLAGAGAVLAAVVVDSGGLLALIGALVAVLVLALRQALVLVRRARELSGRSPAGEAMRRAVEEQAPAVVAAILATAAAFLPAAIMGGGAGLELLTPFAVLLLAGLVTTAVVVLGIVPTLYPAFAGLRPPDDDLHEEGSVPAAGTVPAEAPAPVAGPAPERPDGGGRGGGRATRTGRRYGLAPLVVAVGLGLTGCQAAAQDAGAGDVTDTPAVVEPAEDGGPATLTLVQEAEERLGLETAAVTAAVGREGELQVPYEAVVYDTEGQAWAFERTRAGTYRRTPLAIDDIVDGQAILGAGPAVGTEVVTVGAAELVGVEAGLSGGE